MSRKPEPDGGAEKGNHLETIETGGRGSNPSKGLGEGGQDYIVQPEVFVAPHFSLTS